MLCCHIQYDRSKLTANQWNLSICHVSNEYWITPASIIINGVNAEIADRSTWSVWHAALHSQEISWKL